MRSVLTSRLGWFLGIVLGIAVAVGAQQGVPGVWIQQSPTEMRAATAAAHSHTTAATITITPPGGMFVYITSMDIINCAGATTITGAAPLYITTTNLTGSPQYQVGVGSVAAGLCNQSETFAQPTGGLKSSVAGTAVTYVLPTFATNQTLNVNVYYYVAP